MSNNQGVEFFGSPAAPTHQFPPYQQFPHNQQFPIKSACNLVTDGGAWALELELNYFGANAPFFQIWAPGTLTGGA